MAAEAYMKEAVIEALNLVVRDLPSTTSTADPTTSSSAATPAPTSQANNNTQSPLLFFVALGFGVVFTNLWIIVGVKYCFRYNARNRALARGEDGDTIVLETVNTRPHRRRREKKLMTMDEVNERFPHQKYKAWTASRAQEGLPSAGGVAAPLGSRPATLRNADGVIPASPTETKHSTESRDQTDATPEVTVSSPTSNFGVSHFGTTIEDRRSADGNEKPVQDDRAQLPTLEEVNTNATHDPKNPDHHEDDASDDEDHIHSALGPDILDHPGDSCAICIDTLEEDDDVRGLTCGHAFHASCLDPWLTSRRASCPLCKADYYIPKPRPEGEPEPVESRANRRDRERSERANMPRPPRTAWTGIRSHPRVYIPGRFMSGTVYPGDSYGYHGQRSRRARRAEAPNAEAERQGVQGGQSGLARFAGRLNPWRREREEQQGNSIGTDAVTPAQLEAQVVR